MRRVALRMVFELLVIVFKRFMYLLCFFFWVFFIVGFGVVGRECWWVVKKEVKKDIKRVILILEVFLLVIDCEWLKYGIFLGDWEMFI